MVPIVAIAIAIAIPCLLSGPLHGAVFGRPTSSQNVRRRRSTAIDHRRAAQLTSNSPFGQSSVDEQLQTDTAPINGTMTSAAPVLLRSGSCSQVSYGTLDLEKRDRLKDLPLNELLIQLQKPSFVTAPNPDGPTIVDIGLYVYEIAQIDAGENTYLMEGFVDLVWCDPRLRFDPENGTDASNSHIFLEHDAAKELEYIWWPTLFFVNEVMPRRIENEEVIIFADGTVEYREKFGVQLSTNYDMRKFPFDTQVLIAEIESFAWPSDVMVFHIEKDIVGFSDEFEVPEFTITGVKEHLRERLEPRDRHAFSELVAEIYVTRDPVYYVTKVLLPLTLIVCISWAVFWMDGSDLADRMAISFTGVLTSVAYQFIVAESLPRHIYNTFLDNFVLFSFVMMALTIVENISVSMFLNLDKHDEKTASIANETSSRVSPIEEKEDEDDTDPTADAAPADAEPTGIDRRAAMIKRKSILFGNRVTGTEKARHLDKICRYAFPMMFAVGVSILAGVQISL